MSKPILSVDFDGVLHSYSSGWKGARNIPDVPVPGAIEFLSRAMDAGWEVVIHSSRARYFGGISAMRSWLRKYAEALWYDAPGHDGLECIRFARWKPSATLTIDDRAMCFDGDWPSLDPKELRTFKPWNKRPQKPVGLGATGTSPQGLLNDDDEGALRMAMAYDPIDGIIKIDFGKPVAWIGLPPPEARALANMILNKLP